MMLLASSWAFAFEFETPLSDPVHEALTAAAFDCLRTGSESPVNCDQRMADADPDGLHTWYQSADHTTYQAELDVLRPFVNWPDQPGRIGPLRALTGLKMGGCRRRVLKRDATRAGPVCEGHYGGWQFFHAQPSAERGPSGRADLSVTPTREVTRDKTVSWVLFNFDVATGAIRPDAELYSAVQDPERFEPAFARALLLPPVETGLHDPSVVLPSTWTVADLYGLKCNRLRWTRRCRRARGHDDVTRAATGALLHALQDSYSMSHATRGEPVQTLQAEVACSPIRMFHRYQDGTFRESDHGDADGWPAWRGSCKVDGAVGPITASARALHAIEHRTPRDEFRDFIQTHVLGLYP